MGFLFVLGLLLVLLIIGVAAAEQECRDGTGTGGPRDSDLLQSVDELLQTLFSLPSSTKTSRSQCHLKSHVAIQPSLLGLFSPSQPRSSPMSDPAIKVPGYVVERELLRTTQSIIYNAAEASTGEEVIIKQVKNDAQGNHELHMLELVMQASGPYGPKHVGHLLHVHEDDLDLYLVLELFDGLVADLSPDDMTALAVMNIALDAANGLVEMDRAGIVDDDVKPANMAFKKRSGRQVHIDLGYARLAGQKPVGYTDDYGAPEIRAGVASSTSPCYGWGRSIEWLCCGRVGVGPKYRLNEFIPWIGKDFALLIARCVEPQPTRRPSVHELHSRVVDCVKRRRRCERCNTLCFGDGGCPNCH